MSEPTFKICKCDACKKTMGCKRLLTGWFCSECSKTRQDAGLAELFNDLFKMEIKGG